MEVYVTRGRDLVGGGAEHMQRSRSRSCVYVFTPRMNNFLVPASDSKLARQAIAYWIEFTKIYTKIYAYL